MTIQNEIQNEIANLLKLKVSMSHFVLMLEDKRATVNDFVQAGGVKFAKSVVESWWRSH